MINITPKIKTCLAISSVVSMAWFFAACDVLEDDATPRKPTVEVANSEFHIPADGSAYIDLYSMVKTNAKIRLNVSSQPDKGDLSEPAKGLLRYAPFENFNQGRDSFAFSIFDEHDELLLSDTIIIIVEEDSTNLPCGYYPHDDYAYASNAPIAVNVLANDFLCGDSLDVKLEIYRPDNSFPPHHGTATVNSNYIVYTANSNMQSDTVVYKVSSLKDNTLFGYAVLHIAAGHDTCSMNAFDDFVSHRDSTSSLADSVDLRVTLNDQLCGNTITNFMIVDAPSHGEVRMYPVSGGSHWNITYYYSLGDTGNTIQDSLQYKWCVGPECHTAKTRIQIHR
jgi:hypothetical protein